MTGMMIAMTLGMTIGLLIGTMLGVYLKGNLFYSTFISMGIGLVIGFVSGFPISAMAIIDGLLAGAMGGMMGAMLGEMIHFFYQDSAIKIMFVLAISILLILIHMMVDEITQLKEHRIFRLFKNPIIIFMVLIIFFYGFNQLGPVFPDSLPKINNEGNNHH